MVKHKLLWGAAVAVAIAPLSALSAYAQENAAVEAVRESLTFELTDIDCRSLLQMEGDEREFTLIFFHGVMTGKNGEMTFDEPVLAEATDNIVDYCIDHPEDALITVFEKYRPRPE